MTILFCIIVAFAVLTAWLVRVSNHESGDNFGAAAPALLCGFITFVLLLIWLASLGLRIYHVLT